jgi:hypothetical protein
MDAFEVSSLVLIQNANKIHHAVGAGNCAAYCTGTGDWCVKRHDLANVAVRPECGRTLGVSPCYPDDVALIREALDNVATDKARATENSGNLTRTHGVLRWLTRFEPSKPDNVAQSFELESFGIESVLNSMPNHPSHLAMGWRKLFVSSVMTFVLNDGPKSVVTYHN